MTSGLELDGTDGAPVLARGTSILTRRDLKARSDALLSVLRARAVRRALVCSDDPADLLRAIDACNRAGADLFIAHTNLSAEHLNEIIRSYGVTLRIGSADQDVAGGASQASEPSGRIFMMTSGTTGAPKIASHSLGSLLARARAGAQQGGEPGKWLLTYQPTGFAGIQVTLTATVTGGLLVSPELRTPASFFEAAHHWRVTHISGTPTFWRSFLMVGNPSDLALKQITLGGEAADQATLDRIKAAFPQARITHTYASTEAGVVFAVHDGREGFPSAWLTEPPRGVQLRIRDGFLQVRSPHAMGGYLRAPSQPLLEDGWLATADRCEIVADRVRILGRDDSTINVAGSKVYPLMIEQFLLGLPGVAEARVYASPNPISGQLVGADVVLDKGFDPAEARPRLLAACRENLATYQVPRVFKIVDAIAVSTSGKKG